jgi:DNA-directed RNA polymerase specialized sigma24 family protein
VVVVQIKNSTIDEMLSLAIAELTVELREVILLVDIMELSEKQASKMLKISTSELMRRLSIGRNQLEQLLTIKKAY